jgi:hypothetical protein
MNEFTNTFPISNTSINYILEENIPEEQINNVNEPNSVFNINRGHIVLTAEGNIKYLIGNYIKALLLYMEAISDLKSQLATFPCRELAVLFGNMSDCHMQLDDIEQSYKAAVTCVKYDSTCYKVCYNYDFIVIILTFCRISRKFLVNRRLPLNCSTILYSSFIVIAHPAQTDNTFHYSSALCFLLVVVPIIYYVLTG